MASIVPEVYTTISEAADHVIRVLQQEAASVRLSPKNRDLLRDIIKPNLENTAQSFSVPLYIFLAELEAYLRKKLGRVVSYYGLDIREVYNKVGVRNQPDKLTLGDVLQMYSAILTAADQARGHLSGNWESLVELRNKVIHGRYVTDDWPAVLKVLIPQIPRLEELVGHVQTITEPDGTFTYLG